MPFRHYNGWDIKTMFDPNKNLKNFKNELISKTYAPCTIWADQTRQKKLKITLYVCNVSSVK